MKSYQFTTCRRENGQLVMLDLITPIVTASTRGDALKQLESFFTENNCRPHREVT